MEAGHSTQQHSDLAVLYPRSKTLQTNIIEFFIVVVQICLRFHRYAQKSALGRFTSSLNDSDIKELRSSLIAWSKSIQEEITTLVAQTVETEAKSNSGFRALMSSSSNKASEQQRHNDLRKIRNRCSTYDYETPWRQIRKAGNTCLYKQLPEYNRWIVAPASETLVLVEKLGYGKSVTLANIVDDLNLRIDPKVSGLAYFFCRHDCAESKYARTVMGALVRQIISPLLHLFDESHVLDTYNLSQLFGLIRRVIPSEYVMYIILDGLEICSPLERKTVTKQLELLTAHFNVHVCISRRLEPYTELQSIANDFPKATVARLPNNASDIETYVVAQLETALSTGSLILGEPTIILDITESLLEGSQHMFLWVALQIQSLCMMQSDHDIRKALTNLPQDLSQIYSQILQQAKCLDQPSQSDIFKLILAARRPLTLSEMREALSVAPGCTTWDHSKLLNSVYPALASCGCLITVDEEEHTIRTVHPSVNQFLLQETSTTPEVIRGIHFTMEDAQSLMSSILITYLGYGIFGTELAVRLPVINVGSPPAHVSDSTMGTNKGVSATALKLLRSRKQTNFDPSDTVAENFTTSRHPDMDIFDFQHYAKLYALQHLSELPAVTCAASENLLRMLRSGAIIVHTNEEAIGLLWLMLQPPGRSDVLKLLTHINLIAVDDSWDQKSLFRQLLHSAIANGRMQAIKYLLDLYCSIADRSSDAMQPNTNLAIPVLRDFIEALVSGPSPYRSRGSAIYRMAAEGFFGLECELLCVAIKSHQDCALEIIMRHDSFIVSRYSEEKPIFIAARQQNIGALRILFSEEHRKKLPLATKQAGMVMALIEKIEDDFVPSLLSSIKDMYPKASPEKWR